MAATFPCKNDVWSVFTPICFVGNLCFICYLYVLYITYTGVQDDSNMRLCSRRVTKTQHVQLLVQELISLFEHPSLPWF
jgi:hypothetical protein